jgi:hypothetical protein
MVSELDKAREQGRIRRTGQRNLRTVRPSGTAGTLAHEELLRNTGIRPMFRPYLTAGIAIAGASLIVAPPVAPPLRNVQAREIQLTSVDTASSPLGDGTAFVFGPSGVPVPPQQYVDAADTLYLQPNGFTGTAQAAFIPDGLEPFTGIKSLGIGTSLSQDVPIMALSVKLW